MTSSLNNPQERDFSLNQRSLTNKDYLKEVLYEEYIKYFILFTIASVIVISCTVILYYKMNDLESNLLTNIQEMKANANITNKDINMVN